MKPRDCFGVVVRSFGLFVFLLGIYYLIAGIILAFIPDYPKAHSPAYTYCIYCTFLIGISLYLLRGAPHLIRFCYPDDVPPLHRNEV
jgi:hypothetical protein